MAATTLVITLVTSFNAAALLLSNHIMLQHIYLHYMMLQEAVNPLHEVSPYTVAVSKNSSATMTPPDDSAMINVPKFDSAPETGEIRAALGSAPATHITAPPAVYNSRPPLGASSNSRDPEAIIGGGVQRLPTSGNEGNASSAGSLRSQRPSRVSGGGTSVPELFRQRSHMPLDEVEMGPLLGRGAYGRVFKGVLLLIFQTASDTLYTGCIVLVVHAACDRGAVKQNCVLHSA